MKKRFLAILTVVATVLVLVIPTATPVLAENPAGANSNDLILSLGGGPVMPENGDTVNYVINLANPINPSIGLITADAINISVAFYPPGSDGLPTAAPSYTSAAFNLVAGGGPVTLPVQNVTLALDPCVSVAIAKAILTATSLKLPENPLNVTIEKTLPLTVSNSSRTIVTITPSVVAGNLVNFTVTETNLCGVDLTNPYVVLSSIPALASLPLALTKTSSFYIAGDTNADAILNVGETWIWIVPGIIVNTNTTITVIGHGTDPMGNDITYPASPLERAIIIAVPTSEGLVFFTTSAGIIENMVNSTSSGVTPPYPPGMFGTNFPFGFFSFKITGLENGQSVDVTVTLPNGSITEYWKYGPTSGISADWYNFTFNTQTGATFAGNIMTLHFTDGQRGDSDLDADGDIEDPGGPAAALPSPAVPGVSQWGILALALLLGSAMVWMIRRRLIPGETN
jgi:hypothetical protein